MYIYYFKVCNETDNWVPATLGDKLYCLLFILFVGVFCRFNMRGDGAAHTGHGTSPRHSIQTRGWPVAVLSIDVGRHDGIHNYLF